MQIGNDRSGARGGRIAIASAILASAVMSLALTGASAQGCSTSDDQSRCVDQSRAASAPTSKGPLELGNFKKVSGKAAPSDGSKLPPAVASEKAASPSSVAAGQPGSSGPLILSNHRQAKRPAADGEGGGNSKTVIVSAPLPELPVLGDQPAAAPAKVAEAEKSTPVPSTAVAASTAGDETEVAQPPAVVEQPAPQVAKGAGAAPKKSKKQERSPTPPGPEPVVPPVETAPTLAALAAAPTEIDGFKTNLDDMRNPALKRAPVKGTPKTLADAILTAISDNALIKAGEGTAAEALAAVGAASANLYPQLQGRVAAGPNGVSTWQAPRNSIPSYYSRKNTYGAVRGDLTLTGEQLIYDFGATKSGVAKAAAGLEAQNWSVLSSTDDIAFKTAGSYLKIIEERELLELASDNLVSLEEIANLVNENQKNGNGTVADVKRVNARVIDAGSTKADQEYALKLASDELRRLIQMDPGRLSPPPTLAKLVPPDETKAYSEALKANPKILSYRSSIEARMAEIRSIKQGTLPKVVAEVSASNKQYQAVNDKTDLDMSAMLAVRYKFLDGGYANSQIEAAQAKMFQDEMRMRDTRETIESDLRRDYFALKLARGKSASLAQGVDLNAKARSLYREQFQGGKRSLLELLEVQNAYYLSKRSQITNQFEERRANFSILRSMGRFAVAALTFR